MIGILGMLNATPNRVSLKRRVLAAGSWSVAGYIVNQILRFGSNILMTRLLAPDAFGVMAIAYVIMGGLATFSDFGVKPIIIRSERGNDPDFLNTAWTIRNLQFVLLWLLTVGFAVLIALANHLNMISKHSVYADPRLPYVIAIVSFSSVIRGFTSTKIHEASRNMNLRPLTFVETASYLSGVLFMLGWAVVDRSIWALVWGALFGSLIRTILSHIYLPGTPNRWHWDKAAVHEITAFGKWIVVASILGYLANNADRMLLGGMMGAAALGTYAIAFFIFKSVDEMIVSVILNVTLPALSETVRENPSALKGTYYRFHAVISPFTYFCSAVLIVSGQALIGLIYDPRYYQAGWMLQILAIALLATPFGVAERCFVAIGLPKYIYQLSAISLVVLLIGTIGGFRVGGLAGAIFGIALSFLSSVPLVIYYQMKHDIFDVRKELYALLGFPAGLVAGLLLKGVIALL
jgi:O-antigen/teichoic acid export membrane protein